MYIKRNQATTVAEVVELNTGIKAEEFIKPCKLPFIKNIKEAVQMIKEAKEKEVPINIIGDYEYLEKSIEFCQKQGMEVLLLRTPDPTWTVEKHNVIQQCAEKYKVPFLDCCEKNIYQEIGIDWKVDGNDSQHLNYHGATKFTKYLGEYLTANYKLKDHRREKEEEKLGYDFEGYKKYMDNSRELEKQIQAGK